MLCTACNKESKNLRVCPYCFTPYPAESAPGKRATSSQRVPTEAQPEGRSGAAEMWGQLRGRARQLWSSFRRQSKTVQFAAAGIVLVLGLWWFTGDEPEFEAGVVQSDIIATPLQQDEALAVIKQTRESAIVDVQQDEVFVSYPASTFPVLETGQLALAQQFAHADEIVEGRRRRIYFYNPNGKLFAQADGKRGVVLVR